MPWATRITGTFAPVPTPVDDNGDVEQESLQRHLRWLDPSPLDGVVVLGTNGEFPSFTLEERHRVAAAAAAAGTRLRLILGVGSCSVREVLAMAATAASCGYEAVLCPPPFYFRLAPVRGIARFFEEVCDAAAVPVLLYHIPQVTGVPISDELLDAIGEHERVAGVKDSSGDPSEMRRLAARFAGGSYLVGSDRMISAARRAGGSGSITAAASVAPDIVVAAAEKDGAQGALDAVRSLLEEFELGPSVKALLRHLGLGTYGSRPPVVGLEREPERTSELVRRFEELRSRWPPAV